MAARKRLYSRLTRPIAGLASYTSLWLGPDHLLLVSSTGYTEQYQRFQFSDIQAFLLTPTTRRGNWSIAWAMLALLLAFRAVFALTTGQTPYFSSGIAALCVVLIVVNHLLGPTCKVVIVTRIQTLRLPLRRRRKTDRLLARVAPLIEGSQSDLTLPLAPPVLAPSSPT